MVEQSLEPFAVGDQHLRRGVLDAEGELGAVPERKYARTDGIAGASPLR